MSDEDTEYWRALVEANANEIWIEFVCWLMGYPPEWLSCAPSATPSTCGRPRRSSRQRLDDPCAKHRS